ncbi:Excreted virulence factor EspC, type VII ESX diderm [Amycolatopsis arida]|uniref:Excreted virulence factor EspC, type VII ESX diderm n=1 Tax=Amycolatopsis arida TaxID=587909 RepID=A0A1I6A3F3_9PSEU|nr:type VII secretion target [Amycolatopsis arida]TDX88644.1 excreted virulence factor EspC (type VII ESX diderm) [Amycolatopsis arida]SFQ63202.1 Excreted virulence factor EspC, type VII ESX diderm [Amycolatopsis arida]
MEGYRVELEALRRYSRDLAGNKTAVNRVSGLVGQADVGNESWGVVGLFVKERYTDMLTDLKELLTEVETGLQSASDKIGKAAEMYQEADERHRKALAKIVEEFDATVIREIRA